MMLSCVIYKRTAQVPETSFEVSVTGVKCLNSKAAHSWETILGKYLKESVCYDL